MLVNDVQRGNEVLKHVVQVSYEYKDIPVDYLPNPQTGVLFLSVKYHRLHPEYLENKLKAYYPYRLLILALLLDTGDYHATLKELQLNFSYKLVPCASNQECAMLLEQLSIYANKTEAYLQPRIQDDYKTQAQVVLTTIHGVNKSDVIVLLTKYKTIKGIANATVASLLECPGIARTKAERIHRTFHAPLK